MNRPCRNGADRAECPTRAAYFFFFFFVAFFFNRVTSSRSPRVPRWLLPGTLGDGQKRVKNKIHDGGDGDYPSPTSWGLTRQICSWAWEGRRCSRRLTNS